MPMKTKTTIEQKPIIHHNAAIPKQDMNGFRVAPADSPAFRDNSTKFREAILGRYEAPFRIEGWLHGGLNE
jgi:hypothetical protein